MTIRCGPLLFLVATLIGLPDPATAMEVEIQALGAEPVRGTVRALTESTVQLTSGQEVAWDRLIEMRTRPAPVTPKKRPAHWRVRLVGGEVLHARIAGPGQDADALKLDVEGVGVVELNLDALSSLEYVPADAPSCYDLLEAARGDDELDVAYDARDDALRGTLVEVTESDIAIEDQRETERRVTWARLRVLRLANEPLAIPKGAWGEIELGNGTRLHTEMAPALAGKTLIVRTRSLPDLELRVPAAVVEAIRWKGGAFVWASDLDWTAKVDTGSEIPEVAEALRRMWAVTQNRRVGLDHENDERRVCPLRVNNKTYRHGFAAHSIATIRLPLDKAYASFLCKVGIDDEAGEGAPRRADGTPVGCEADVQILRDGVPFFLDDDKKKARPLDVVWGSAISIGPIDVTGVNELVLVIGLGRDKMNTRDRVDILDPLLVRAK